MARDIFTNFFTGFAVQLSFNLSGFFAPLPHKKWFVILESMLWETEIRLRTNNIAHLLHKLLNVVYFWKSRKKIFSHYYYHHTPIINFKKYHPFINVQSKIHTKLYLLQQLSHFFQGPIMRAFTDRRISIKLWKKDLNHSLWSQWQITTVAWMNLWFGVNYKSPSKLLSSIVNILFW